MRNGTSVTPILKRCACGRAFTAGDWGTLLVVGVMLDPLDPAEDLELRLCPCGSSLGIRLFLSPAPAGALRTSA